jgi:hypothetical protein
MGNVRKTAMNSKPVRGKKSKRLYAAIAAVIVLIAGILVIKGLAGGSGNTATAGGDLLIKKGEISETATFYPYRAGGTKMEVLAVKASDGTVRTAFNTCQVCFSSGKGYYKQEGDTLVCQNCGNVFQMDQVEKIKGGCNPVPILEDNKSDDGSNIVITGDFLTQNKDLFGNWKK